VTDANDRVLIEIPGESGTQRFEPWQISSVILRRLLEVGNSSVPSELKTNDAVITVPAYFNDGQREDTLRAAREAGINVLQIVNEPTAAAVAVRWARPSLDMAITLIYDFGGGTLDVSLLEINSNRVCVCGTAGDTQLGGRDFDACLCRHGLREFQKTHPDLDLEGDNSEQIIAKNRVFAACHQAKIQLSTATSADVCVDNLLEDVNLSIEITRTTFEDICANLFNRCLAPIRDVLSYAQLGEKDVTCVILVGGSTRIPKVQQLIDELFPQKRFTGVDPRQAVVQGAALLAAKLKGNPSMCDIELVDVCPLTIGYAVRGDFMRRIIERGTQLPVTNRCGRLTTSEHNQSTLDINIVEGERKLVATNTSWAHLRSPAFLRARRGRSLWTFGST
jgi:L1 cell adhesion molecule like protein